MNTRTYENYNELIEKFVDACHYNIKTRSRARSEIFLSYSPNVNAYFIFFKMNDDKNNEFLFTIRQAKRLVCGFSNSIQYIEDPGLIKFIRHLIEAFSICLNDYQTMVVQRH